MAHKAGGKAEVRPGDDELGCAAALENAGEGDMPLAGRFHLQRGVRTSAD